MPLTKMSNSFQECPHTVLLFSDFLQTGVFTGLFTSRAVRVCPHCCPSTDESWNYYHNVLPKLTGTTAVTSFKANPPSIKL